MNTPFTGVTLPGLPVRKGKVRDIFDLGDRLFLVATDRISAFDWVLEKSPIPDKGRVLTQISQFWFQQLGQPHHCLSTNVDHIMRTAIPATALAGFDKGALDGRCMLVKKVRVVMVECVVRGYLEGSGWKEYQKSQTVCGIKLPAGLVQCSQLPEPIFTPATKEETGHDENITFERMCELVGADTAKELRQRSIDTYRAGAEIARKRNIIIADTKFEYGYNQDDTLILIDEVLTPDSSRFWPADTYEPGHSQLSLDKQYVREWLEKSDWDKNSLPPALPADVVAETRRKYIEVYEQLTLSTFPWK